MHIYQQWLIRVGSSSAIQLAKAKAPMVVMFGAVIEVSCVQSIKELSNRLVAIWSAVTTLTVGDFMPEIVFVFIPEEESVKNMTNKINEYLEN